jgi:hypothetical protein
VRQAYITVPIVLTSLFILTFERFEFAPLAFFGAALWIPANMLACSSCRIIGVGIAQSCWAGGICITSFLWGALGRRLWAPEACTLQNVPLAVLGLVILIAGNASLALVSSMMASSSSTESGAAAAARTHKALPTAPDDEGCSDDLGDGSTPERTPSSLEMSPVDLSYAEEDKYTQPLVATEGVKASEQTQSAPLPRKTIIQGLLMCTCGTGVCIGAVCWGVLKKGVGSAFLLVNVPVPVPM